MSPAGVVTVQISKLHMLKLRGFMKSCNFSFETTEQANKSRPNAY